MSRVLLASICLGIAGSSWIVALLLKFRDGGYERGREEGYKKGYEDGEVRTHLWWIENGREVEHARQQIREEQRGWRDIS